VRQDNETAEAAACREVEEEVGILVTKEELAPLPQLRIHLAGKNQQLLLDSFVCFIGEFLPMVRCSSEIESAFWIPAQQLWDAANLDSLSLNDKRDTLVYPAIRFPQGMLFGITLRVITLLSDRLGIPLQYLEEIPLLRRERS